MIEPSFSQSLPLFGCFFGTFSPSRRQMRSTRLWFTCHPSSLSSAVIRRYPYLPNRTASLMMSFVSDSSSSRDFRTRRCVALGWLSTIQALRSDTAGNTRCTRSTHLRRREGLRSFPRPLLSGSAYPGQDRQPFASAVRFPAPAS